MSGCSGIAATSCRCGVVRDWSPCTDAPRPAAMSLALFAVLVATGSFGAGLLGAVTGLGGGIVVVPMLTVLFHVDIRYAIGASLACSSRVWNDRNAV
jgi:uncharacterized membrane protein YfcA